MDNTAKIKLMQAWKELLSEEYPLDEFLSDLELLTDHEISLKYSDVLPDGAHLGNNSLVTFRISGRQLAYLSRMSFELDIPISEVIRSMILHESMVEKEWKRNYYARKHDLQKWVTVLEPLIRISKDNGNAGLTNKLQDMLAKYEHKLIEYAKIELNKLEREKLREKKRKEVKEKMEEEEYPILNGE